MYAGACLVAGASAPARLCLPPTRREKSVCQDTRVSQHTLRAVAQHSGRRTPVVRRLNTTLVLTDGVPAHTTFVHAGAWIVTIDLLFGVPAYTTCMPGYSSMYSKLVKY